MFTLYSKIFLVVFGGTFIVALIYSLFKLYISRKFFNKESLQLYEESLKKFAFCIDDDVEQIAKKMNVTIQYKKIKVEAFVDEDTPNVINVNERISTEKKNFAVTHELGHLLRGYDLKAARDKKNFFSRFSPEEQICDYYAAAILLPIDDLKSKMDSVNFNSLNEDYQADFVKEIAQKKHIIDDVVYRRISEINLLYS